MATVRTVVAGLLVFTTALASPALAAQSPRHVLDQSALASAVAERAAADVAQRAAIQEALARPEVRGVAAKAGVDVDRLAAHVATLDGAELGQVADAAQQVNHSLAGGASTVVISTTTIIIVLLVIILIVVAVD
jgi:hypothetical protein